MDERIGQLMAVVDDLGLREKTLIIFQSDHGHSVEERTHFGGGHAGPYRGAKFSLFEGGIRVPAIVSMPGTIPEEEVRDQLAHGCDWFPTILEFVRAPLLNSDFDGEGLKSVILEDAASPHDVVHWHVGDGPNAQWAVRQGEWKLIGHPVDPTAPGEALPQHFLSNLSDDISEQTNFADDHPDVVQRLQQLHEDWLK